jgi:hypothetical protein
MTDEEQRQFDKHIAERVAAVRDLFTAPSLQLKPEDEPAVVFTPEAYPEES